MKADTQNAGTVAGNLCNASPAADGVPCLLARVSFTGELGYEIYCAPQYQLALYEAIEREPVAAAFGGQELLSNPPPSERQPSRRAASRSPPCAPIPGQRIQARGCSARTRLRASIAS